MERMENLLKLKIIYTLPGVHFLLIKCTTHLFRRVRLQNYKTDHYAKEVHFSNTPNSP